MKQYRALSALLVVLPSLAVSIACSRTHCPPQEQSETPKSDMPVDGRLLAFLSRAKSAHHRADIEEERNADAAVAVLVSVVEGPIPSSNGSVPAEAREVIADTRARIAELLSRSKQFEAAARHIDLALTLVPEVDYYRGHLFETRGVIEERRSNVHKAEGNDAAAETARAAALSAFETAMQIQAEVIRRTPVPSSEPVLPTSGHSSPSNSGTFAIPQQGTKL